MANTVRVLSKVVLFFAAALTVLLATTKTFAQDVTPKLVIVVEGGGGEKLAAAIAKLLPDSWTRAESKAFGKASKARKVGATRSLDTAKTKGPYIDRLLAATNDTRAGAVLVVRVPAAKKNRSAKVLLLSAKDKKPRLETSVKLGGVSVPKDAEAIATAVSPELPLASAPSPAATLVPGAAGGAGAAAGTATKTAPTAPGDTKPSGAEPGETAGAHTPPPLEGDGELSGAPAGAAPAASPNDTNEAPLLLDASVGIDFSSRHFRYNDPVTANLRPYDVDFVPTPAVKLALYPLAKTKSGVLRDIGLFGALDAALGLDSEAPDGTMIATTWTRIDVGLRGRIRLGPGKNPAQLGLELAYGRETFAFRDQGLRIQNELPSVAYQIAQIGLDARVPLGPVAVFGGFAYLPVLRSGDVGKRIRGQTAGAVEAELGLALPFARFFEVRAGVDYRRYFFSFEPELGDAVVAGGALDQMLRAKLALAFMY